MEEWWDEYNKTISETNTTTHTGIIVSVTNLQAAETPEGATLTGEGAVESLAIYLGDDEAGSRDATVLGKLLAEVLDGGGGLDAHAKLDLRTWEREGERWTEDELNLSKQGRQNWYG